MKFEILTLNIRDICKLNQSISLDKDRQIRRTNQAYKRKIYYSMARFLLKNIY